MKTNVQPRCEDCAVRGGKAFPVPFSMAFQPIYDTSRGEIFAHEALVRTMTGGGAWEVLSQLTDDNRYSFDQSCRTRAIELASRCGMTARLSINFLPNAIYNPEHCIQATLWAADRYNFPIENIIFEFTEGEQIRDTGKIRGIIASYKARGFQTAIDDFGAGFAGLGLLADVVPDIIKIDMHLIRDIDTDPTRRGIVRATKSLCDELGVTVVAEGIETFGEFAALADLGVTHIQGYLLARPQFESLVSNATLAATLAAQRPTG